MKEKYYVQRLARQSINQIAPIPDGIIIPDRHLHNIENDRFVAALKQYQDILKKIYSDIIQAPERFGMERLEIDYDWNGKLPPDEAKSRKSFFRFPIILFAFAKLGILTNDSGICIDVNSFCGFEKLTKPEIILERLTEYGFEFEGLPDGCNLKNANQFTVYYPDNPVILAVLKSFANIGHYERIVSADYRYIISEKDWNSEWMFDDVYGTLIRECDKKIFKAIHDKMTGLGFNCHIQYAGFWSCVKYFYRKEKKETVVIHIERGDEFILNIRPLSVEQYSSKFGELSERVRNICLNGANCRDCGYCPGGYKYDYGGKSYYKCRFICANFHFTDIIQNDTDSILYLLDWELTYKVK